MRFMEINQHLNKQLNLTKNAFVHQDPVMQIH